jgi:hypothetical protein
MQTRRYFLGAGLVIPAAARNWEREAFPDWSDGQIDKLLTDSPWARPLTLPFRYAAPPRQRLAGDRFAQIGEPLGLPKGWPGARQATGGRSMDDASAPPVQTEIYLTVRWATALPVRQAMALHQYGRAGLGGPKAVELLRGTATEYVLEIAGFPAGMVPQGVRRFEAQLLESATLLVKGRKGLRASAASVPEHGNHLISTLRFARFDNLSESDGFIEFSAQAGPMDIHQKFKLRDMNYKGHLEL